MATHEASVELINLDRVEKTPIPEEAKVSWDDYMAKYAAYFTEYVDGDIIPLSPSHIRHDEISEYLRTLLKIYLGYRPLGRILGAPFVMKSSGERYGREPDLMFISTKDLHRVMPTYFEGAPDIAIEIISPESVERDHGTKYKEYEEVGVPEYWIIDPIHAECRFYRRGEEYYTLIREDDDGYYTTPQLPDFRLHIPRLWLPNLPDGIEIVESVKHMTDDEKR